MTTTETRAVATRRIRSSRRGPLVCATAAVVVLTAWPAQARIDSPPDTGQRDTATNAAATCGDTGAAEAQIAPPQVLGKSGTPDRVQDGHGWLMR